MKGKRLLYIGTLAHGGTSAMRNGILQEILSAWAHEQIDTRTSFSYFNKLWQSIGFRWKVGLLPYTVNKKIKQFLQQRTHHYDLIWIDKAVYLYPSTTQLLRSKTEYLVHYTPDPAFTYHQSRFFRKSLKFYHHVITTKSYELDKYKKNLNSDANLHFCTQGYSPELIKSRFITIQRKKGVVFIGHYEKNRAILLQELLDNKIPVLLAGIHWGTFVKHNKANSNFEYLGSGVFGEEYIRALSSCWFGLGALSKWVPELHTTRTFEIPACGTILITEKNRETEHFFNKDEVVFYDKQADLVKQIKSLLKDEELLKSIAAKGRERVLKDGRDYESIMTDILKKIAV